MLCTLKDPPERGKPKLLLAIQSLVFVCRFYFKPYSEKHLRLVGNGEKMKIKTHILVLFISCASACIADDYYDQLISLMRESSVGKGFQSYSAGLIDPQAEMCSLRFGMSMGEVVEKWGKPTGIEFTRRQAGEEQTLLYGASRCEFANNKLYEISFHNVDFEKAKLWNGVTFGVNPDEFAQACSNLNQKTKFGDAYFEVTDGTYLCPSFWHNKHTGEDQLMAVEIVNERVHAAARSLRLQDVYGRYKVIACFVEKDDGDEERTDDAELKDSYLIISRDSIAATSLLGRKSLLFGNRPGIDLSCSDDNVLVISIDGKEESHYFEPGAHVEINGKEAKVIRFDSTLPDGKFITLWLNNADANKSSEPILNTPVESANQQATEAEL